MTFCQSTQPKTTLANETHALTSNCPYHRQIRLFDVHFEPLGTEIIFIMSKYYTKKGGNHDFGLTEKKMAARE